VAQDEKKMRTELDAAKKIVEKLENKICRGCQAAATGESLRLLARIDRT
jgi:hypothetical protein